MHRANKEPKKPNPERLKRRALHYLERFSTSRSHLRFVLLRRAGPEATYHEIDTETLACWVDQLLDDFERIGYLNDQNYAEQIFRKSVNRGMSAQIAVRNLRQKGINDLHIKHLLEGHGSDQEREAAIALARRKRIGRWRRCDAGQIEKHKELAILARAGFSYKIAQEIVDQSSEDLDY